MNRCYDCHYENCHISQELPAGWSNSPMIFNTLMPTHSPSCYICPLSGEHWQKTELRCSMTFPKLNFIILKEEVTVYNY